jgi:hypothetical protein
MANYTVRLSDEFDQVRARLALFPERLRSKIMRGGIRAGAVELRKGARARAPRGQTRQLLQSIRVSMRNYRPERPQADVKVGGLVKKKSRKGVRTIDAYYSHMVEIGVKPHRIEPATRQALAIRSRVGRVAFVRGVRHPGFAGRRFMQATRIADAPEAVRAFERYVVVRARAYLERGREPEAVK